MPILFVQRERSGTASLRALPSLIEGMQTPDVRVLLVSKVSSPSSTATATAGTGTLPCPPQPPLPPIQTQKVNASGAPSIFQPHNLRSMVKVMHSFICYASHEGTECDIPTAESIADVVAAMEDPQPDNCMDEVAEPQEPKPKKSQPKISNSQPRFSALLAPKGVAPASAVKTSKTAKAKGKAAEGSASQVLGISKKAAGRKRKEEVTAGSLKGTTTTMRVKPAFPREGGGSPGGSMDYQREDDEFDGGSEMASGYEEPQFSLQQGGWRQQWAEQGDQPVHQSQGRNAVAGQPWVSAEGHRYSGDFAAQGGYEYYQR